MRVSSRSSDSGYGSIRRLAKGAWHSRRYDLSSLRAILAILALYFAARFIFFDASYFFWDEAVYVLNSYAILGQNYYNELSLSLSHIARPPLVSLLLLPFLWFSKSDNMIKFYPILLNVPAVLAAYLLGRELDKKVSIISAFLLAIFPFHILSSRWVMTDSASIIFFSLSLFYQYRGLRDKRSIDCVLGGFFLGLAILTKFTSLYVVLMAIPLCVYFRKRNLKNISYIASASALTLSPYLLWNYLMFHNPIQSVLNAWFVMEASEPVSRQFTIWTIIDFYGPILILLLAIGIYLSFKSRNRYLLFQFYCFASTLLLYLLLIDRGVAKPPSIEWEVERFLLPTLPFSLVIISYVIARGFKYSFKSKMLIGLTLAIIVLSSIPSYQRAYTPAIEFENGLRKATKDMGIYINENTPKDSLIYCSFNYPSIAYYAQRSTRFFPSYMESAWDELSDGDYLVIYSGKSPSLSESLTYGLRVVKAIGSGVWNVTLLQK